jgi:hypothetical protein
MVSRGPRSERGGSTLGCLISLLVFGAAVYYGVNIGKLWLRYYQFLDEMQVSARLAPTLPDPVIRRRLEVKANEIGLPPEAKRVIITRGGYPRVIHIEGEYSERVTLPLFDHVFVFRPDATEPL